VSCWPGGLRTTRELGVLAPKGIILEFRVLFRSMNYVGYAPPSKTGTIVDPVAMSFLTYLWV
jgi:hypothetical protein